MVLIWRENYTDKYIFICIYMCISWWVGIYDVFTHTQPHWWAQWQYTSKGGFQFWGICYLTELSKISFKTFKYVGFLFVCLLFVTRKHNSCYSFFFWWQSYGGFRRAYFRWILVGSFLIPHLPSHPVPCHTCPTCPTYPASCSPCTSQRGPAYWSPLKPEYWTGHSFHKGFGPPAPWSHFLWMLLGCQGWQKEGCPS